MPLLFPPLPSWPLFHHWTLWPRVITYAIPQTIHSFYVVFVVYQPADFWLHAQNFSLCFVFFARLLL